MGLVYCYFPWYLEMGVQCAREELVLDNLVLNNCPVVGICVLSFYDVVRRTLQRLYESWRTVKNPLWPCGLQAAGSRSMFDFHVHGPAVYRLPMFSCCIEEGVAVPPYDSPSLPVCSRLGRLWSNLSAPNSHIPFGCKLWVETCVKFTRLNSKTLDVTSKVIVRQYTVLCNFQ